MKQLSFVGLLVCVGACVSQSALAQGMCASMDSIFADYDVLRTSLLNTNDVDGDGFPEEASLSLMEAVVCVGPDTDLKDATLTAYALNLVVFNGEADAGDLVNYRRTIAALMAIGVDFQVQLKSALGDVLTGSYVAVQCSGTTCTPDLVSDGVVEVFSIVSRATDEPYSGTGNLDLDGTNNVTEYNNIQAQNGFMSDFVIAATSPQLTGSETLRNPGANGSDGGGGGCFIATAAYGTPMAGEVDVLRDYRDGYLLTNVMGAAFVDSYYRVSPAIADVIATRPVLRSAVRGVLIPVIWLAQMPWFLMGMVVVSICLFLRAPKRNGLFSK